MDKEIKKLKREIARLADLLEQKTDLAARYHEMFENEKRRREADKQRVVLLEGQVEAYQFVIKQFSKEGK